MSVYALIPARGGSKGVPRKNLKLLAGFPLIAYSIAAAKLSKTVIRTVVSTDDEEIARVAEKYGAEVPFIRPAEFARDDSPDLEFVLHAIEWLKKHEQTVPEYLVHLRPTTPLRKPQDIDAAVELFKKNPDATSLRSGFEIRESPYKLFGITDGYFTGLFPSDPRPEYHNLPRQSFPPVYQPDGYVDLLRTSYIEKHKKQFGDKILAFISENTGEIDTQRDFEYLEFKIKEVKWEIYDWLKNNFS